MRKVWVILFFIVVFGLPIVWYLFLQTFGENQFELPVIEKYDQPNCEVQGPVVLSRLDVVEQSPNEFDRILKSLNNKPEIRFYSIDSVCTLGYALLFIDQENMIRGTYRADRADVDRLLAEVDIYIMNLQNEKSSSGQ